MQNNFYKYKRKIHCNKRVLIISSIFCLLLGDGMLIQSSSIPDNMFASMRSFLGVVVTIVACLTLIKQHCWWGKGDKLCITEIWCLNDQYILSGNVVVSVGENAVYSGCYICIKATATLLTTTLSHNC